MTGQYLELAVYQTIKDVLQELGEKYHVDYEIFHNIRVADKEGKLKMNSISAFQFRNMVHRGM